jgi:uncharacterized membrane protein YedE/YeeE
MKWLVSQFRKEEWSPYVAGIGLGLVSIFTVLLTKNSMGASGAFENLAGWIGKEVSPHLFDNLYFNFVMPAGISWQVYLVLGAFFGGMLGAISSRTFKLRVNDDAQWNKVLGKKTWKRWLLLFIGGVILEYGAGIAGGCTDGLAISGGMLLAPSAFMFMAGMFMSGIPTAWIVYRKYY